MVMSTRADLFEIASRKQFRFNSAKGELTVEDLWHLPLMSETNRACLDDVARRLDSELNASTHKSFVEPTKDTTGDVRQKFDLVMAIIAARQTENRDSQDAHAKAQQKRFLLSVLAQKQEDELRGKSMAEIEAAIAAL